MHGSDCQGGLMNIWRSCEGETVISSTGCALAAGALEVGLDRVGELLAGRRGHAPIYGLATVTKAVVEERTALYRPTKGSNR